MIRAGDIVVSNGIKAAVVIHKILEVLIKRGQHCGIVGDMPLIIESKILIMARADPVPYTPPTLPTNLRVSLPVHIVTITVLQLHLYL